MSPIQTNSGQSKPQKGAQQLAARSLSVNYFTPFLKPLYSFASEFKSDKSLRPSTSFIFEGRGGVGEGGSGNGRLFYNTGRFLCPTSSFFFFFFFYDYVLFGNSVIIRRAIYLIDFLAMCYGPFISIGIILLFCFCLFVRFYFL